MIVKNKINEEGFCGQGKVKTLIFKWKMQENDVLFKQYHVGQKFKVRNSIA